MGTFLSLVSILGFPYLGKLAYLGKPDAAPLVRGTTVVSVANPPDPQLVPNRRQDTSCRLPAMEDEALPFKRRFRNAEPQATRITRRCYDYSQISEVQCKVQSPRQDIGQNRDATKARRTDKHEDQQRPPPPCPQQQQQQWQQWQWQWQ